MASIKIVLCEDDEVLSKVILEELKEAGFDVSYANNGVDGLKTIQSVKPSLVLLDVLMPQMDGFAVLEALKKSPDTMNIPVIMLTMLGSDDDIKKGLKLGANDYIVKSQHAVGEICDKVKEFFAGESHPEGAKPVVSPSMQQRPVPPQPVAEQPSSEPPQSAYEQSPTEPSAEPQIPPTEPPPQTPPQ
jgi:CheY-like chemotaxis protein